jgi:nucleoside-diphosphate-sugar epimerase
VALVRGEDSKQELDQMVGVTAILGDALDTKNVYDAMDGCDAAITTLGGTTDDRRVDYEGNSNVIQSAEKLGVEKIILVTSIGWYVKRSPLGCVKGMKHTYRYFRFLLFILILIFSISTMNCCRP